MIGPTTALFRTREDHPRSPDEHQRALDTKGRTNLFNREKDRRHWLVPWVLSLGLHAGAILFLLPKLLAAPAATPRPEVIRVSIAEPPDARESETMTPFTELPADREDAAPETPDFLSNVTSRARDRVPGGEDALPRLQGESDARAVELAREQASRPPAASAPQSSDPTGLEKSDARAGKQKPGAASLEPVPLDALRGAEGNSAFDQPEMQRPDGNASFLGDVSLNTTAWEYAPWLQRFGVQLQERWYAPAAYRMGVLKEGGWALVEVEITKSGKLLRLVLLDEQGHPSLIRAAESALRSMSPIEPLPADFPEPTLILRIRMIYPELHRR